MVTPSKKIYLNRRRGISTIVGGIIFLVLLSAGFSTFFVAMDVQQDTINTQRTISNSIIEKTQEQFSIAVATDDSDGYKLGIQVKNEGSNPIQISNIWIINKSEINYPVKNIPVYYNDAFITSGSNSSILETQHLTMVLGDYDIKVVSTLGTIKKVELNVGGNNYLLAELFTIPPDVRHNENVTLALRVTNVGPSEITGVAPDLDFAPAGIEAGKEIWLSVPEFISPSPVDLKPTESTIFSWQSTLNTVGTFGSKIKFSNSVSGTESTTGFTVNSNTASDKIVVRDPAGTGGSGEEIVIKNELFAKPDVFMIVPNMFGHDTNQEGIWGITVANPTDAIMKVSKISLTILYAGANSNQEIFTVNCVHTNYAPTPTDFWECTNDNNLVWYDTGGFTQDIPARSAYTFLVTVDPGKTTGGGDGLDSVVVHAAVFTTLGSFGEASWTSAMSAVGDSIVNVYLTDETAAPWIDVTKVRGSRMNIDSGSTTTFKIVLADLDTDGVNKIEDGTQLIINVPKEWQLISPLNEYVGFIDPPLVTTFTDGSSQIVGTLIADLATGGKMISFDATAPNVACHKMYIMHVLANGKTEPNDRPIGPVAEIVLQVKPPGGVCT